MIFIKKLFYLFFPLLCGSIIGLLTSNFITYNTYKLPPLSPPGFIFPIVWSILYLLMGISYYLYKNNNKSFSNTDLIYYLQLIVNLLWSIIFFVFKWNLFSIIWIILLLILVIYLIKLFLKENKISAYLNIPYLIWITFATYLTISIYILN